MKWIRLRKEKPKDELDFFGNKKQFLLGVMDKIPLRKKLDWRSLLNNHFRIIVAYIDYRNEIVERETGNDANMTYWTHWAEIPDVPEFKP